MRMFDLWFCLLPLIENLKTLWGLESEFQAASFERNRSFLALFVWEVSKSEAQQSNDASMGILGTVHLVERQINWRNLLIEN